MQNYLSLEIDMWTLLGSDAESKNLLHKNIFVHILANNLLDHVPEFQLITQGYCLYKVVFANLLIALQVCFHILF